MSSEAKTVVVTGAAGRIAEHIVPGLAKQGYRVRGFDRLPMPGIEDAVEGELTDRGAVREAMRGMETVIHLGAQPSDAPFVEQLVGPNVVGLYHVCHEAVEAGVKRLILASSIQAVSGLKGGEGGLIRIEHAEPDNHYGLTKVWAEQMGQMYAHRYGVSVLAARIGWFVRHAREARNMERHHGQRCYLSHDDGVRFFNCAVESPKPGPGEFAVVFAVSRSESPMYDLEPARRLIGYEAQDTYPEGLHLGER